jgi:hypothetical protein
VASDLIERLRAPMWRQEPVDIQAVARDAATEIAKLRLRVTELEAFNTQAAIDAGLMYSHAEIARLTAEIARLREALYQVVGALGIDAMVDDDGKPFGTTVEAIAAARAALNERGQGG